MIDMHDALLAELTRALVKRFEPERVLLFGSRARGDQHAESDYDVMIVVEGQSPPSEDVVRRAVEHLHADVDFVIDTSERFERRRTDVGTLEYAAERGGRVLHSRSPASAPRLVRERPHGPPESLEEWAARAHSDFIAMTELARIGGAGIRDAIVFHAHQSVEKMLKTVLIAGHIAPPRTHDLERLLSALPPELRTDPVLQQACRGLHELWPSSRYPNAPMPSSEHADLAVGWARTAREIFMRVVVSL